MVNHKGKMLFCLLLQMMISFSIPWLNQIIIDRILINKQLHLVFVIGFVYLIFALMSVFLHVALPRISVRMQEEVNQSLRVALIHAVQENEHRTHSNSDKGDIITIFENDIQRMSHFLTNGVKDIFVQGMSLLLTIATLLSIDIWLGLLSMIVVPIYLFLPLVFKEQLISQNQRMLTKWNAMNALVQEVLNGIVQIRIFNKQQTFLKQFQQVSDEVIQARVKEITLQKLASATIIIYWLVMLCVLWLGGARVLSGKLTIGVLLVVIHYVDRIEWPVARLAESYSEYQRFIVSKKRWEDRIEQSDGDVTNQKITIASIDTIAFNAVDFSYSAFGNNVFEAVTLDFKKGDFIGMVGKSGMGKSTFLKLLFAFERPTKGNVFVNGIELQAIDRCSYRARIGYLSQESYLFEMSLFDNISFGSNEKVSEEAVYLAAKQAGADSFIQTLEKGYQTIYGKERMHLSQGQMQRIALARIFLRNPDVIILDEPTASLDKKNTKQIIKRIKKTYGEGKIVLLITHDSESLNVCNQILTVDSGRIERTN